MIGRVNSFHSFSTHDGPGIRAVVFLQGCPLRCLCCHNPETWNLEDGEVMSSEEVIKKIKRGLPYYRHGGVTCSGGEPLLQPLFVEEIFKQAKSIGLHTTLDTSGCVLNDEVEKVLNQADLVLLDIKKTTEEDYQSFAKGSLNQTLEFLNVLEEKEKPTWIRHVIFPSTKKEEIERLKGILRNYQCIEKVEFLPFKKLCLSKYKELGIPFPLENEEETVIQKVEQVKKWYQES